MATAKKTAAKKIAAKKVAVKKATATPAGGYGAPAQSAYKSGGVIGKMKNPNGPAPKGAIPSAKKGGTKKSK